MKVSYNTFSFLLKSFLVNVPEPVYAKISLRDTDNLVTKVRNCWATPTADDTDESFYSFIESFSVAAGETDDVAITQNCESDEAAFMVNTFSFDSADTVYFHCEIDVCNSAVENCSCGSGGRKRRSIDDQADTQLKIGPITIGK